MRRLITQLLEPKEHAPEAAFLLTELLGAKITRSTLEKEIKGHPNYPAFLSISDVLTGHGVENLVAKFDEDKLVDLPTPFITQVNGKKQVNQFTVVKEVANGEMTYFNPENQQWVKSTVADFGKKASGIILLAELEEPVTEKDYQNKVKEEKRVKISRGLMIAALPVILLLSGLLAFGNNGYAALLPVFFTVLTLLGTAVTVLLLWYEVDQGNVALKEICQSGRKTDCGAILGSKEARIFGISWSAIGFVYFTGSLISLLVNGITLAAGLTSLAWISLAAVPYTFFSIYYQWKVAKQWCVLCLSVQAVLILQCVVAFAGGWHTFSPILTLANTIIPLATAYAVPFIIVTVLVPALRKAKENGVLVLELQRLKHSPEIFNAVLEKQKAIAYDPAGLGITLGNPNASVKIVKVCNPYCGPCARAHTPMEELLHNNPDLQIQMIFTAMDDPADKKSFPVKHLLAIDQKNDSELTEKALDDWYLADVKDYDAFAKKYPMNGELKKQGQKLAAMSEWCNKTEIMFTPTFFVNGYQLPPNYSVNDLKYFLSV